MTIGGSDKDLKKSNFDFCPVVGKGYWAVQLKGVGIYSNGKLIQAGTGGKNAQIVGSLKADMAVIDSGTSLMTMNQDDFYSFMRIL